jgi:hypothetical protein
MPAQYPILSAIGKPAESMHMAKYVNEIATDFEDPGIYDSMFVFVGHACGAEHLIVQINVLIVYITIACLFCTEIRRYSRQIFHFVSLHA